MRPPRQVQRRNGDAARVGQGAGIENLFVLELAYPPFAYVLSIDEPSPAMDVGNITNLATLGIDQKAEVEVTMRTGFGHTMYPLDYRSRAMLERDLESAEPT